MNNRLKYNYQLLLANNKPLFVYISINVLVFFVVGILEIFLFLFKQPFSIKELIWDYAAFPASIQSQFYKIYTAFTYQFLHRDLFHLLFNMLTLFWFGKVFTDFLKPRQFHFVYFLGGIMGALVYALAFNVFPAFEILAPTSLMLGASASVMAIAAAAATLAPNVSFQLLFFGNVRIKYLVLGLLAIDVLLLNAGNAGGNFAHIGGALAGFVFIKLYQQGNDLSKFLERKPKLKVVKPNATNKNRQSGNVSQEEVDKILDKISASGYEGLTKEEKQKLFKASGKN